MYRLSEKDIHRLIIACNHYKNDTSSVFIYEKYVQLIEKLNTYLEQNIQDDN